MRKILRVDVLSVAHLFAIVVALALSNSIIAAPFPQLLPGASNFELTVREDPNSKLPLGPSCGGEAEITLACRAFVVTLKNIGPQTVRLSRIGCQEPVVSFEMKEPNSSSGWWMVSQISSRPRCSPWTYENFRLRPGKTTEYKTRLVSPNRSAEPWEPVTPRTYTIRASWQLWGCTENPEGTDCLSPLQVMKPNSCGGPMTSNVEIQEPVEVVSNEIDVNSPTLSDLGPLKIGFDVSLASESAAAEFRKRLGNQCASDPGATIECTVFHYAIRNLGNQPIRNGRFTCSDDSIIPQYRTDNGEWKSLQPRLSVCTANVYFETPIMPSQAMEGTFTLSTLAPEFDTTLLYPAGSYELHFHFQPSACFASPDGSFCLQRPKEQPAVLSNVLEIRTTAFTPIANLTK